MRKVLETPGRTAALVTPDRALARRVAAEVRRWDVEIDDSAGQPLGETPPGTFFRLVAQMAAERLAPVPLLAALKHPLAAGGMARVEFRRTVRALELAVLRGPRSAPDLEGLVGVAKISSASDVLLSLVTDLGSRCSAFLEASRKKSVSIVELLEHHIAACETLAADERNEGAERMWGGDAGAELAGFVGELHQAAAGMAPVSGAEYVYLLARLLGGRVVRPRWGLHPRLNIWGLLEARLQRADVMILGGLNEGTWPPDPHSDPWLSRPMREAIELPTPERKDRLDGPRFRAGRYRSGRVPHAVGASRGDTNRTLAVAAAHRGAPRKVQWRTDVTASLVELAGIAGPAGDRYRSRGTSRTETTRVSAAASSIGH